MTNDPMALPGVLQSSHGDPGAVPQELVAVELRVAVGDPEERRGLGAEQVLQADAVPAEQVAQSGVRDPRVEFAIHIEGVH